VRAVGRVVAVQVVCTDARLYGCKTALRRRKPMRCADINPGTAQSYRQVILGALWCARCSGWGRLMWFFCVGLPPRPTCCAAPAHGTWLSVLVRICGITIHSVDIFIRLFEPVLPLCVGALSNSTPWWPGATSLFC
jgi:hypothetical protein